jgi:hypothetical protein
MITFMEAKRMTILDGCGYGLIVCNVYREVEMVLKQIKSIIIVVGSSRFIERKVCARNWTAASS